MADKSDLPMLAVKRPLLVGVLNLLIVIAGLAAFAGIEVRETAVGVLPSQRFSDLGQQLGCDSLIGSGDASVLVALA